MLPTAPTVTARPANTSGSAETTREVSSTEETATSGSWTINLDQTLKSPDTGAPGFDLVGVEITAVNNARQNATFSVAACLTVTDSSHGPPGYPASMESQSDPVAPGSSADVRTVYEVPGTSAGLLMTVSDARGCSTTKLTFTLP
jgi:hypothetical protein